jgi:hypothetical protein
MEHFFGAFSSVASTSIADVDATVESGADQEAVPAS